ncbi:hypothetical protein H0X06_04965 [Candidatus Dependentiae bacterium]|nr:hypothetical protein [Candidatus Dependentiae bacterium]
MYHKNDTTTRVDNENRAAPGLSPAKKRVDMLWRTQEIKEYRFLLVK